MEWMIMPLKRYAEFSGRSRRQEFWLYTLFVILLWILLIAVLGAVFGVAFTALGANPSPEALLTSLGGGGLAAFGLLGIIWLALLIPGLAVSIRRMHDTDRSGWWAGTPVILYYSASFLPFVLEPGSTASLIIQGVFSLAWFVTGVIFIVFSCLDGTRGPNRFGADPKDPSADYGEVFS